MTQRLKPKNKTVDWAKATGANKQQAIRISEAALAFARSGTRKHPPLERQIKREQVFLPYKPPPGVLPDKVEMAFDDFCGDWATSGLGYGLGSGYANSNIGNWDGFIGYPELSLLAQRPEYRRIIEVIATECTRKWIRFESNSQNEASKKKLKDLEIAVKRFRCKAIIKRLVELDGYFGRGHLYIDLGSTDNLPELKTPIGNGRNKLSIGKCSKDGLKRFGTVEPVWCYPTQYESQDPLKPTWYKPEGWFCMGKEIHGSRLVPFITKEVPDLLKPAYNFGGLPLAQMVIPYVNNWLQTRQSVNDIISSFSTFVLATNLSTSLQQDGDQLFRRAALFNLIRDNRGLMMLDKDSEDFKNVSAPLGSLDHLQAQAQEHMASVSGIPLVKLLGIQPSGLNASSEGEIRTFYDNIGAFQENNIEPILSMMIDFVQLSTFGEVDEDINYSFVPLWSLDEKSEAEKRKTEADTHVAYIESGVFSQEEIREVKINELDSPYVGLDPEDVPDLPENIEGEPTQPRKRLGAGEEPVDEKASPEAPKAQRGPKSAKAPKASKAKAEE